VRQIDGIHRQDGPSRFPLPPKNRWRGGGRGVVNEHKGKQKKKKKKRKKKR
jgi:hypothetical protein